MSWSPQQEAAIKAARKWLLTKGSPQVFRIFGFAGTGKTTLAKEIAGGVNGDVLFGAFTGKASLVLRKKGCTGASTIHRMIYKPIEDAHGRTVFKLNPDSAVTMAKLVIIDEVSMVDEILGQDLLSYGTKVLVLGDPGQLRPVRGEGYFINTAPDVMLTEVHRQAAENPIIRLSMDVREGRPLKPGRYGDSQVLLRSQVDKEYMRELVLGADQLLCGINTTRQTFNARMRQLRGLQGLSADYLPRQGDRLVCLKNNHDKGLLNGGLWEVIKARDNGVHQMAMVVRSIDSEELPDTDVTVPFQFFNGTEKEMDWRELKRVDQFTYGNALTVHKSQGSQWERGVLFDESYIFRDERKHHLYTGLTRFAESVTVVV